MMNPHHKLNALFATALTTKTLTDHEIEFVSEFVASDKVELAILACSTFALAGGSDRTSLAYGRLREICETGAYRGSNLAAALLATILQYLPQSEISGPPFVGFVYETAKHPHVPARINSMRVLRRLAQLGDQAAIGLLKDAVDDTDPLVCEAAKMALKLARVTE